MKLDRRSLFASAGAVAFLYLLALVVRLPEWVGVLAGVLALAGVGLVVREADPRPAPIVLPATESVAVKKEPEPPDPVFSSPPTRTVANVLLPSASTEFQFSFSAVVHWSPVRSGSRHADLGAVAVDAILNRARALTATQQPTEDSVNRYRLAAQLGQPDLDELGQVRSWATDVHLRLPDADSKHLAVLTALHRREQTALLERRMERDSRTYLQEEVLASPGSAVVWWLVNNPGQVEKAADLLSTFSRLATATKEDGPDTVRVASTTELAALLSSLPAETGDSPEPARRSTADAHTWSDTAAEPPPPDAESTDPPRPNTESTDAPHADGRSADAPHPDAEPTDPLAKAERQNGRYREEFFKD